jgi:AraC-like DNA-binding protein
MWENQKAWTLLKQHERLNILLYDETESCLSPKRKVAVQGPWSRYDYYFVFIRKGSASYYVDDKAETVHEGELLFVVPHQIYFTLKPSEGFQYYKLTFDDEVLALLPGAFSFLANCYNSPVVSFDKATRERVYSIMDVLNTLLKSGKTSTALILSYVNTFLSELEVSYDGKKLSTPQTKFNIEKFYQFKNIVEKEFKQQPAVAELAKQIDLSTDTLNRIVFRFSGHNAKEFITQRIILEAKRHLFYDNTPVKELAYCLGFTDPNYFSRLFKSKEGVNISEYVKKMRDLSR